MFIGAGTVNAKSSFPFPEFSKLMLPMESGCQADCWGASCSASGVKCICGCTYLGLSCTCSVIIPTRDTMAQGVKFTEKQYQNIKMFAGFLYESKDKEFIQLYKALFNM